ncbi:MAG: hypothetical protein WCV41_01355 [Patescibacteria group bacterium]
MSELKKDIRSFIIEQVAIQYEISTNQVTDETEVLDARDLFSVAAHYFGIEITFYAFCAGTFTVEDVVNIIRIILWEEISVAAA